MKTILRLILLVLSVALVACASPVTPAAFGPAVKIDLSSADVQAGETIVASVRIDGVANLTAFEAHLSFDPNVLEALEITDGRFVQADFTVQNAFDNAAGTVDYAIAQINREPASGSGTLFEIVLRAKASGQTTLGFRSIESAPKGMLLSDPNGIAIPVTLTDATVSVK